MPSPLRYDGGLTATLDVRDLNASIRWYQEVLRFKLSYRMEELGWCEMATEQKGVNVGLFQGEKPPGRSGGATLCFGVVDLDAARRFLEGKNVRFEGPTRTIEDMVRLCTFFDPDGNRLMLSQDLKR